MVKSGSDTEKWDTKVAKSNDLKDERSSDRMLASLLVPRAAQKLVPPSEAAHI